MSKLCPCLGRKCGSLATPYIIRTVTKRIGTAKVEALKEWVIQRVLWRRKQETKYGKGVQPHNVDKFLEAVRGCTMKGELLNVLENFAAAYHEAIEASQFEVEDLDDELQGLNDDFPGEFDPF